MPTSCSHQMGFVNDFFMVVTIKLLLFVIFVRRWKVVNEIFVRVPSGGLMHAEATVYFSHYPRSSHHACSHSFSWLFPVIFFLQQFIKTSTDLPQPNIYGIHPLCSLLFKRHSLYSASFWLLWQAFQIFFFRYTSCRSNSLHQHGLDSSGFHPEACIMTRVQVFQDLSDLSALTKPNNGHQDNWY